MKTSMIACVAIAAGMMPGAIAGQVAPDPDRAAVTDVLGQFAEYVQADEMDALAALFRPGGLHILADDATTHGWDEYRTQYLIPELAPYGPDITYEHTAVEPVVRGDVAWVAFRRVLASRDGSPDPFEGRGTAVLEKLDGRWLIVHLHMSR